MKINFWKLGFLFQLILFSYVLTLLIKTKKSEKEYKTKLERTIDVCSESWLHSELSEKDKYYFLNQK